MKISQLFPLLVLPFVCGLPTASAAEPSKWFSVEQSTVNTKPGFLLRVDVDKPDRVYREGENMTVSVKSEKDCYLYLLYYSGDRASCLFPNKYQQDNFIRGNAVVEVPSPKADFKITCRPPFGEEVLHVVATLERKNLFPQKSFKVEPVTDLNQDDLDQMTDQVQQQKKRDWAEARVRITTTPVSSKPRKSKRYAVCVGISEYQHDRIQQLKVSHKDAERMAETSPRDCGVEDVTLLTNSQATAKAIEKAIFKDLARKSRPGDTVIIYFSNHGGRCADVDSDEDDGLDEYIVPHDGILGKPDTMILDDTFARWMRELDGRKIAIIFDLCYSAGASKNVDGTTIHAKGLQDATPKGIAADFIDGELARCKDIGQRDTMVIAACEANQLAWEMPEEGKGSVLTYYVLQALGTPDADSNRDGKLTLGETYRFVKSPVERYVKDKFGAEQNPVLIDNAGDSVVLK